VTAHDLTSALLPLVRFLAPLVAAELRAGRAPTVYSQKDGERRPGCGKAKHLRIWRRAWAAGDPGATKDGQARLLTAEAYERHRLPARRAPKTKPEETTSPTLAARYGLAATTR
jgi:hypothetical protein